MPEFYISSTKYSIQTRNTKKHGRVYDVVFRCIEQDTLIERQKRLSGFSTKTLAKEAYLQFTHEHCELAKDIPQKRIELELKQKKQALIVRDLLREYMSTLGNENKANTIYDKEKIYAKFVLPYLGDTDAYSLSVQVLNRWRDTINNLPYKGGFYSAKYIKSIMGHFGAFLSWCESRYGIENNMPKVKKPKARAPKQKMKFWTREEFDRFIAVVDDPMWHCFFTLLFFTGRRKGEIFALTPEDIKENSITFNKSISRKTQNGDRYEITTTKEDKDQTVPVSVIVQDELKKYNGESPFFFGGEKPLADNTTRRVFQAYCTKAGVPIIRIHDLRHSFVSMIIHLGANLLVVADLIGDTVEQVTKTYGHLYIEDKLEIIKRIT